MKYSLVAIILISAFAERALAQDFVTRGRIEFEVKTNMRLQAKNSSNGEISQEDLRKMQEFYISYRELVFAGNEWMYRYLKKKEETDADGMDFTVYASRNTGIVEKKAKFWEDQVSILRDSLPTLRWKIESETRKIAGWQCRKAVTKIDDSVYVIAFYCPEIVPQAGPESFSGLPGMILGLAIPRYYTTWFATKIELADVDEAKIGTLENKKDKVYGKKELAEMMLKKYKDSGWEDATMEKIMQMLNGYVF